MIVREHDGLRWHRCLRCDSWIPLPPPEKPVSGSSRRIATRSKLPLRGRPLRDRYVLRLIAIDRVLHVLVLGIIAALIFVFAHDRNRLHNDYTRILADLQGGLGGPVNNTDHGIFSELNRLFALSTGQAVPLRRHRLRLRRRPWPSRRSGCGSPAGGPNTSPSSRRPRSCPSRSTSWRNRLSALKILTLVINLAVVAYLLLSKRLFGLRGRRGRRPGRTASATPAGRRWSGADPFLTTSGSGAGRDDARPRCSD